LPVTQILILRQFEIWLKPELGFAIGAVRVNMHARFFTRKEEEPEASLAKNGRTQGSLVVEFSI